MGAWYPRGRRRHALDYGWVLYGAFFAFGRVEDGHGFAGNLARALFSVCADRTVALQQLTIRFHLLPVSAYSGIINPQPRRDLPVAFLRRLLQLLADEFPPLFLG